MNCQFTLLLAAVLFFLLTPGVLVRLPPKSGLLVVAAFHAVVFTVAFYLGCKLIKSLRTREGMEDYVIEGNRFAAMQRKKAAKK
jgi:hypothetical protein